MTSNLPANSFLIVFAPGIKSCSVEMEEVQPIVNILPVN